MVEPIYEREQILGWLSEVADPEIPVLSVVDLGIIREVKCSDESVEVAITPTYSGCPATEVIEGLVRSALEAEDLGRVVVRRELSPPWTTDWISAAGREKLEAYGIAPPSGSASKRSLFAENRPAACPRLTRAQ